MEQYEIRAHHGMCLCFFAGKGYDEGFTRHMARIKGELEKNPVIRAVNRADDICAGCPHNGNGVCDSEEKVKRYDNRVLQLCGLEEGSAMDYRSFSGLVQKKVLKKEKRKAVCGDCQWDSICDAR